MQWYFGPYRLDLDNACLWRGEQRVPLRPKTFDLLVHLVEHAGALVTKDALFEAVWPDAAVAEGVLATSMVELRKALGDTAREPQFVATVHRRGYRFLAPVVTDAPLGPAATPPDVIEVSPPSAADALKGHLRPHPGRVEQRVRRLAAILSADVQGYSRLMGEDEAATLQTLTTYRALMAARIAQYRGRVVNAPGDNLLVEFASVVDAVQCAVAMQDELAERNRALPTHRQMWFRMGINLGDVLVEGDQIYGDGVNLAARLEGLAEGGGICVSGLAFDQIETKLDLRYTDLGEHSVKNIVKPVRVYRVEPAAAPGEGPTPRAAALAWAPTGSRAVRPPPHLVSREAELAELQACLARVLQGERQVVFLIGEAGIGKTTLVDVFVAQLAHTPVPWVGRGQCIEQYGAGEAYLPLLEALGELCRGPEGTHLLARLTQQAPSWLLQMPALLSPAAYDTLQRRVVGATRERMLRELAEAVETLSTERPLILVLEDLHWSDASTLEWLAYVARRRQPARLLVLATYRPSDAIVREHPVRGVTQELLVHGHCQQVVVGYLSAAQVETYLTRRFGPGPLGATLAPLLQQRTTGNALFLVTMVDEMVRQGVLHEGTAGWELTAGADVVTLAAPESVRHMLTQQFEQLPGEAQALLEAASVMGRALTVVPVAAAVGCPPEEIEERCAALARRGQWLRGQGLETWPDGTVTARFAFLHDLYRDTAYGRVPLSRRARWHEQIGLRLEAAYGAQVGENAAELANHFVQGRDVQRSVYYAQLAGENALRRHAHQEAIGHLTQGLEVLERQPDMPERTLHELTLQRMLGLSLMTTKGTGASEAEAAYVRARDLCQHIGETAQMFPVLFGLWGVYDSRGDLRKARQSAEQLLALAQRQHDPTLILQGHAALGNTLYFLGEFALAFSHVEQGLTIYDPEQHRANAFLYGLDPGIECLIYAAMLLWQLGYPEQAVQRNHQALTFMQDMSHPYSLAFALSYKARLCLYRREWQAVQEYAEATIALSTEYGFPQWSSMGVSLRGLALVKQGDEEGIALIHDGITARELAGSPVRTFQLMMLTDALHTSGRYQEGRDTLAKALELAEQKGDRCDAAELYRLRGELRLVQSTDAQVEAETDFRHALHSARHQQAKSLELRAAVSLSRLWQQQGKRDDARQVLAEVYAWFTEGFDTADLQEAKMMLAALGA